ncbi:MAG: ABC transporter substrate-binding protein [Actinomycetes bacterium]
MRTLAIVNRNSRRLAGPLAAVLLLAVAACGGGASEGADDDRQVDAGPPQRGGSITVLEDESFTGSYPSGLDPATNTTGGANLAQMQAIYGGLFLLEADEDGSNARIVPNQAESYAFSDGGKTLTIKLRDGITFSDGTPLDAEAVAWNFKRDVDSPCTCAPTQWILAEKDPITTPDELTVRLRFAQPNNAAVISSFPASNVNWIASPTAMDKMGLDEFKMKPVGAGPFTVVTNELSSKLVLKRNPDYFKKGLPYLDGLTFSSIGGDQPAYQALLTGEAHAYEGMATTPLITKAQSSDDLSVTIAPPTSPYVVQLNTFQPPFDDKLAREAIYRATDFEAITKGLFDGKYPVSQMFTGPGGLFHHEQVPGYPEYDLAKAKKLVKQMGGLEVHLGTLSSYTATQVLTALRTQWEKAGIEVATDSYQLSKLIQEFNSGGWQAMLQTAGAWDPAAGVGVSFRFSSRSPFTGVKEPKLDALFAKAAAEPDPNQRDDLYLEAAEHIAEQRYAPFGLAFAQANLAVKGVYGPGLTTKIPSIVVNSGVLWDRVWRAKE